ncbi:DUF4139 domain-containing protein [Sphingomonas sp. So64.6b]|uniref:DUF4139 domain-containing protein n=1 Tax=Sphingomonas sp. So64.6b TaxID=2997354 RepID=UPI001601113C|nr:DUF4139 domain-containing protein [Sphingomonas sp. So64.6b]QNA87149.1 DUF4139 domain-containing protein [Sphingomonas sp. So64.6b]
MRYWIGAVLALIPCVATAQTAPKTAQGDVALTIYSNGVALIQDTRQINLPSGVSRQDFADVSSSIRPATVRLSAEGTEIVEQNYDYDLLSPEALMDKAVGQTVTLLRTNPATGVETREAARVLASNDGVVLQIGNRIEVLREDGLPVRVLFDSLPPNLRARPTLSVTLDTKAGGARPVTLSYLSGGFGWSADYVALFDEAKRTIDVQGWVTLRNNDDVTYYNTDTVLVAGNPGKGGNGNGGNPGLAPDSQAGTETAARAKLGDYYLYPLKNRTTIAANQQKQVSFLSVSAVPARKAYEFRNGWLGAANDPRSAATVLNFSSSAKGGLGDALPAGTVRVYVRDAKGQPQFIGENAIGHTPMGSSLALKTGEAFDVKVKPVVTLRERAGKARWKTGMTYTLTNARPEPVTVDLIQAGLGSGWEDTKISGESQPSERRSADEAVWQVVVPGNGEATLTATFDTRY